MSRVVSLLCVLLVLGLCLHAAPVAAQPSEVKIIKIEPGLKGLTDEQKAAVHMAQDFLEKEKHAWGMPNYMWREGSTYDTIVGKGDHIYTVFYPTSENEDKTLGVRAVVVNVASKKVQFQPRK